MISGATRKKLFVPTLDTAPTYPPKCHRDIGGAPAV